MNRISILILTVSLVNFAQAALVCKSTQPDQIIRISDYVESEDQSEIMGVKLSAQVSILSQETQQIIREFAIQGTREFMAAGYSDELKNDQESFSMDEAFNGSLLNSWVQPLKVIFKGELLNCEKF